MKEYSSRFLFLIVLIAVIMGCAEGYSAVGYKNPPDDMDPSGIVGTWRTIYASYQVDTIIISKDKTFVQQFKDSDIDYLFETMGEWDLESFPDGNVYLHLQSGRYYVAGIDRAERDGRDLPCTQDFPDCWWENEPFLFYDPYRDCFVEMLGQLILTIRVDYSGDIVMHHLSTSSDPGGFTLIGGEDMIFRRIEEP